ncbi:MAG: DUF4118 domain-containing protein [Casimicrobiaceae bacterium]
MLAVLGVVVVFASLNLTTTAADLQFLATLASVAFGIPAVVAFFVAAWLEAQYEDRESSTELHRSAANEGPRPPFMQPIQNYAIAVLCVAIAWGIRHAIDPFLLAYLPFPTFFLGVAIAGWLGGFGPAMLAIVLSTAISRYFYMSPLHELTIDSVLTAVSIGTFVVVSLFLAAVTAMLNAALRRIRQLTSNSLAEENFAERKVDTRRAADDGTNQAHVDLTS